jgi:hypothetical protein
MHSINVNCYLSLDVIGPIYVIENMLLTLFTVITTVQPIAYFLKVPKYS